MRKFLLLLAPLIAVWSCGGETGYQGVFAVKDITPIPASSPISTPQNGPINTQPPPEAPLPNFAASVANTAIGANAAAASGTDPGNVRTVNFVKGIYDGTSTIIIPQGTHDLVIDGKGSTIKRATGTGSGEAIRVGFSAISGVFWSTSLNVEDVDAEDTEVVTKAGQGTPTSGHYYVLHDVSNVLTHTDGNSQINAHLELVKCTGVSGEGPYTATLEFGESPAGIDASLESTGAGRNYHTTGRLGQITTTNVCRNITIKNLTIDAGGKDYGLVLGAIDGVTLQNVTIKNFKVGGVFASVCKDVVIEDCRVEAATASGSGQGYGFYISGSRGVLVDSCTALKGSTGLMRHAYILHRGAMDVLFLDCLSDGGSYDTHGMHSARAEFRNCGHPAGTTVGMDIGNAAWLGGDTDILIKNCTQGGSLNLHPNIDDIVFTNGSWAYIRMHSMADTDAVPTGGKPETVSFTGTAFSTSANQDMFGSYPGANEAGGLMRVGTFTFTNCTWTQGSVYFRRVFYVHASDNNAPWKLFDGTMIFDGCTVTRNAGAGGTTLTPISLLAGTGKTFNFTFTDGTINTVTQFGMILNNVWAAPSTITITGNACHTAVASPGFVNDLSTGDATKTINTNTAGP